MASRTVVMADGVLFARQRRFVDDTWSVTHIGDDGHETHRHFSTSALDAFCARAHDGEQLNIDSFWEAYKG